MLQTKKKSIEKEGEAMFLNNKKPIKKLVFECSGEFLLGNDAIESDFPFEVQTRGSTARIICEDDGQSEQVSSKPFFGFSNREINIAKGLTVTARGNGICIKGPDEAEVYLNGKRLVPTDDKEAVENGRPGTCALDLSSIETVEVLGSATVCGRLEPKEKVLKLLVSGLGNLEIETGDDCSVAASVRHSGNLTVRGGDFDRIDCALAFADSGSIDVRGRSAKFVGVEVFGDGRVRIGIPREMIGILSTKTAKVD